MGAAMDLDAEKFKQIKKLLVGLATYRQMDLGGLPLDAYAEDLMDLELEDIGRAIRHVRTNPDYKPFASLIGLVREAVKGTVKDQALDAATRIVEAITRYGWNNPERARDLIGEIGWRVVEREGGWERVCERATNDNLPTLKAQWREIAAVQVRRGIVAPPKGPALTGPTAIRDLLPAHMKDEGKDGA